MNRARHLLCCCLLALLAWPLAGRADERILSFYSQIEVTADGGMNVTETIRARAEGRNIRHGIYRDFPTDYRDRFGNAVRVAFEPRTLTRDGGAEPFHTERRSNGVRVYFGSEQTTLTPGEYTWSFTYHTNRQLGFFADHDELYWNVTGNGWDFPIDTAGATVELPGVIAASSLQLEAYTGIRGARGRDWTAQPGDSRAEFATTAVLAPREGLTIVVSFPKGIVAGPGLRQRAMWMLTDNVAALALITALLLVFTWYLTQWLRVGRDPKPGTIIPIYEPPAGYTPSALRFVERMEWDQRCVAADLVDAAMRGALHISDDDGDYRIERKGKAKADLPPIEKKLVNDLLGSDDALSFNASHRFRIIKATALHQMALQAAYANSHFRKNTSLILIGVLITIATVIGAALLIGDPVRAFGTIFIMFWLSGWSIGLFLLCARAINSWRQTGEGSFGKRIAATGTAAVGTSFVVAFIVAELFGIGLLAAASGIAFAITILALIATNLLFGWLMKAPTQTGRKLLDQIAGLRLYLGVAERDELAAQQAPPLTADQFHRMLPYALALNVEQNWTNRFAAAVGPVAAEQAVQSAGWYSGAAVSDIDHFVSGLGSSFGDAISSSSTPPGSSSGSSSGSDGGGSSGGGGGGGGGGGW
ncbi:MAG: DUF2207 domain-containing protein [Nevskiaceae bacterium]|jgi:uncharacterized membrane protein YgcG|nr:DUF2207 domain-containing protein [Nevskiaceae bacterium]